GASDWHRRGRGGPHPGAARRSLSRLQERDICAPCNGLCTGKARLAGGQQTGRCAGPVSTRSGTVRLSSSSPPVVGGGGPARSAGWGAPAVARMPVDRNPTLQQSSVRGDGGTLQAEEALREGETLARLLRFVHDGEPHEAIAGVRAEAHDGARRGAA